MDNTTPQNNTTPTQPVSSPIQSETPGQNPLNSNTANISLVPENVSEVVPPQETTPLTQNPLPSDWEKPKSKKAKIFLILTGVIILLVISCAAIVSWAIAYEKLDIPKYPKVKAAVTSVVMSLPFMPKTPKYLIARTLVAHEKVTKHDFNISMSVDSPGFENITGLTKLDIETKGAIDYEDPNNITFILDASLTKDFQIELKKPDNFLYFKVNKVPSFLLAILGLQTHQFDPVMGKWIGYDTTPLETESRKELKKDTKVESLSEETLKEFEDNYLNDVVIKKLKIEKVNEDGSDFYKLSIDFDKETLDHFEKKLNEKQGSSYSTTEAVKLSDVIKEMNWGIFINTKTFLTHKVIVTTDMEVDQVSPTYGSAFLGTSNTLSQNSRVKFALVLKFDKFGEEVVVEKPTEFMTFEEFTNQFSVIMQGVYGQLMTPPLSDANDAKRKSDISTLKIVLELFRTDCGAYPKTLDELVTPPPACSAGQTAPRTYLFSLPTDPTGEQYFYMKNPAKEGYDLCTNLDSAGFIASPCPDPSYNYHVSFP